MGPIAALADTLEGLEEDVKEETGADVRFPLDEKGAEVLLVTPSADLTPKGSGYSKPASINLLRSASSRSTRISPSRKSESPWTSRITRTGPDAIFSPTERPVSSGSYSPTCSQ